MINIQKSYPAPICLAKEIGKPDGNYKCGDVLERLQQDFHNKCYLCEQKAPTSINVEHFIPKHLDPPLLSCDWANLFFACSYCNKVKGGRTELLDCTNPNHKVSSWLKYEIIAFPKTSIRIKAIWMENDPKVKNTADLLNHIYEQYTTPTGMLEAGNLKDIIVKEIRGIEQYLSRYFNPSYAAFKPSLEKAIIKSLDKSSTFVAFKYWVIKSNPQYREVFGDYCN